MKLNLTIVQEHLSEHYHSQLYTQPKSQKKCSLRSALIYTGDGSFSDDILWIVPENLLPAEPPAKGLSVICLERRPPAQWTETCNILWISNVFSLYQLCNDIFEIFLELNRWESEIYREITATSECDIEKLLALGVKQLKNPIHVTSGTLTELYKTISVEFPEGQEPAAHIIKSHDLFCSVDEAKDIHRITSFLQKPYFSPGATDGHRLYCKNIIHLERFIGCLIVEERFHTFSDGDLILANTFFSLAEPVIQNYILMHPAINPVESKAFSHLLQNIPLNTEERHSLTLQESEKWFCFFLARLNEKNYMAPEPLCATLHSLLASKVLCTASGEHICGLLRLSLGAQKDDTLNFFKSYIQRMGYSAGLSLPYQDVLQTKTQLHFAKYALETGRKKEPESNLYWFRSFVLEYILKCYSGEFPIDCLYPPGLSSLLEHDKNSSVSYTHTLRTYLDNAMSIPQTASALFLHRSSLISRLEKIRHILKMDLDNARERLYLQICLYFINDTDY